MKELFITIEGSDPQNPEIKVILTERLVEEFIELYPTLKEGITQHIAANPSHKDNVHIMTEFGDHVLYYSYMQGEPFICFIPADIDKAAFIKRFGQYLYNYFCDVVNHILTNPEKSKAVFQDLYFSDKN